MLRRRAKEKPPNRRLEAISYCGICPKNISATTIATVIIITKSAKTVAPPIVLSASLISILYLLAGAA